MVAGSAICRLPLRARRLIDDYRWGGADAWRHALRHAVMPTLPPYSRTLATLRTTPPWRRAAAAAADGDTVYCERCGEKGLWYAFLVVSGRCVCCGECSAPTLVVAALF